MLIPKIVVTYATFPGVIVHQAASLIFCRLRMPRGRPGDLLLSARHATGLLDLRATATF